MGKSLQNQLLVDKLKLIAQRKGCTAGQLALSWVHHQGDDVFPIPGLCNSPATTLCMYVWHLVGSWSLAVTFSKQSKLCCVGQRPKQLCSNCIGSGVQSDCEWLWPWYITSFWLRLLVNEPLRFSLDLLMAKKKVFVSLSVDTIFRKSVIENASTLWESKYVASCRFTPCWGVVCTLLCWQWCMHLTCVLAELLLR